MTGRIDQRLAELGITLPDAPVPSANYVPYRRSGNQVFIAGQVSITGDESATGKVGGDLSVEDGYAAARLCGLNILAQLKACVGDDIDRAKAVKLGGFVNAPPDFTQPPAVVNGVSDLLIEVMGEDAGKPARFAVVVASLPGGAAVEVDAIFEIE
jgi:enamine deaminase RidA (YjgF/YER057c/UK114 family)